MAFIRFVGCSVGKDVCVACDTDFENCVPWRGGGTYTAKELLEWSLPYKHLCLTGGEPLDQDLDPLVQTFHAMGITVHIETSGTKYINNWLHALRPALWVCVSPKPGFIEDVVMGADEVKVIMPGLGVLKHGVCQPARRSILEKIDVVDNNDRLIENFSVLTPWPTLEDALRWARAGKTVFIQPRNQKFEVDGANLKLCQDIVAEHPELRLSVQLHKVLHVQ